MSVAVLQRPAEAALPAADARWMAAALAIGRRECGRTWPNPAVGAIILDRDGHLAGRGWTALGGRPHAETQAIARAGERARGGTLYVTLEPCSHHGRTPPCAEAIAVAGLRRVVAAIADPNPLVAGRGFAILRSAGIEVEIGVGADEARRDHAGHFSRILRGRPHVQLKIAASADGKSALAGRKPVRITGEASRAHTYLMRAAADAVVVGIGTVLADDPMLTVRLPGMENRSPGRIVLDSALRTPVTAAMIRTAADVPTLLLACEKAPREREDALRRAGADVQRLACGEGGSLDLHAAMHALGARGVTRLLVEGGPILSAALLKAGLVDELLLFRAPAALGPGALPAVEGTSLDAVLDHPGWSPIEERMVGADRFTRLWRG